LKIERLNVHLAEINIARLQYPLDDPRVEEFVRNLDRVNAVAERTDGFVWRLKDGSGDATSIRAFPDPMLIVNMSVWRDALALEHFVWNTVHKQIYTKRAEWFSALKMEGFAMWEVAEGELPSVEQAKERLDHLNENGNTDYAFGWGHLPHIKLWQQAKCG
jgi:hypothetical protein